MGRLNNPGQPLFEDAKTKRLEALQNVDLIFPYFEKDGVAFDIKDCISAYAVKNKLQTIDILRMQATASIMLTILIKEEEFAIPDQYGNLITLTSKGEKALELGGRTAYLNHLKEEADFNKRKEVLDYRTKEFVFRFRWLPYFFSSIAFIASGIGLIVSIKTCNINSQSKIKEQKQIPQLTSPTADTPKKHR